MVGWEDGIESGSFRSVAKRGGEEDWCRVVDEEREERESVRESPLEDRDVVDEEGESVDFGGLR